MSRRFLRFQLLAESLPTPTPSYRVITVFSYYLRKNASQGHNRRDLVPCYSKSTEEGSKGPGQIDDCFAACTTLVRATTQSFELNVPDQLTVYSEAFCHGEMRMETGRTSKA